MSRFRRPAAAIHAVATFWPTLVFGQAPPAGVVTTLEGNVTVTRVALPQPQPLKFKDDVFVDDKVTTGDQSIARMLLGGKAVVTVRERSTLTITEVPGKATIELDAGKIALAVARDRMKAGESIEVRTANAVAGVRGTVLVAEVSRATAQVGGPPPALVTTFTVLSGQVQGFLRDQTTGAIVGAPVLIGTLQQFRLAGFAVHSVVNVTPAEVASVVQGLSTRKVPPAKGGDDQVKENALNNGITDANSFTGVAAPAGPSVAPPPVILRVPILPGGRPDFNPPPKPTTPRECCPGTTDTSGISGLPRAR